MPVFLSSPTHNPAGPDGQGWNRISIIGIAGDQCAARPTTEATFWEAMDSRRARYGGFGACTNAGRCGDCAKLKQIKAWPWFGDEILIRVDEHGTPWAMNRPDDGWGESAKPTTWEKLSQLDKVEFTRYSDKHGRGVLARKVA